MKKILKKIKKGKKILLKFQIRMINNKLKARILISNFLQNKLL